MNSNKVNAIKKIVPTLLLAWVISFAVMTFLLHPSGLNKNLLDSAYLAFIFVLFFPITFAAGLIGVFFSPLGRGLIAAVAVLVFLTRKYWPEKIAHLFLIISIVIMYVAAYFSIKTGPMY